ncbi:MAG: hypothetical protein GY791_08980 [Alphaproteobacteria bacterium]|nr:hypothetical protein [Alphaproteobacteria bacterium]
MQRGPRTVSFSRQVLSRAAIIAIIFGTALALFNQTEVIFGAAEIQWLPLILGYLTPFLVVSVSQVLGIRAARAASIWIVEIRESFPKTLISHGIPGRALALSLAVGGINTAIIVSEIVLAGRGYDQLPVALILQALILPLAFGALSQAVAYRRAVRQPDRFAALGISH